MRELLSAKSTAQQAFANNPWLVAVVVAAGVLLLFLILVLACHVLRWIWDLFVCLWMPCTMAGRMGRIRRRRRYSDDEI